MKLLLLFIFGGLLSSVSPTRAQNPKYDTILAHMPSELSQQIYGLVNDAQGYQQSQQYDSAINCYQQILTLVPNFAPALTTIAGYCGMAGRYGDEIKWSHKAIAADSSYLNAYLNLGNAYASLKMYDSAAKIFSIATRIDPRSPVPAYNLGSLAEEQHNYTDALQYYLISTEIDSTFTPGYYNCAIMYENLNRLDDAKEELLLLLRIDPSISDAEQELKNIEAIRKATKPNKPNKNKK